MKIQKGYIAGLICALAGVAVVGASIFLFNVSSSKEEKVFDAKKALESVNTTDSVDDFLELSQVVLDAMKEYGTQAGFEVINEGERMGLINNDVCHGLLHYVGHSAFAENPTDYDALIAPLEGTACIGGYLHGIEAEIMLVSGNAIEEVKDFCQFQRERKVNPGACYHGVGHAATEMYNYDVPKSLALCDALEGGPESDLTNCYRGVFSEVGNVVVGYDGHTGLEAEKLDIPGLEVENPYKYCESLDEKYQSSCKSQFTKIVVNGVPFEKWTALCAKPGLSESSINVCVNSTTGVYVRQMLSFENTTTLPEALYDLPLEQQKVGILGSAEAFAGYYNDNEDKDWRSFCNAIPVAETKSYCIEVFTRMEDKGEAPWMERSDIR